MRDYVANLSDGKRDVLCDGDGAITLSKSRRYDADHLLVEEAMDAAVKSGGGLTGFA